MYTEHGKTGVIRYLDNLQALSPSEAHSVIPIILMLRSEKPRIELRNHHHIRHRADKRQSPGLRPSDGPSAEWVWETWPHMETTSEMIDRGIPPHRQWGGGELREWLLGEAPSPDSVGGGVTPMSMFFFFGVALRCEDTRAKSHGSPHRLGA